jgi:hypothetical protein
MTVNNLPQRPIQHVIAEQGISILRNALPSQWILREISPDYGLDCEIEIVSIDGSVTGALIKAQVKATADSKMVSQIRTETIRYWLMLPIPVILIRVFNKTSKVIWLNVRWYLNEINQLESIYSTRQKSITFNFEHANILPQSIQELENLGTDHQKSVLINQEELESQAGAQFVALCLLVIGFNGEPETWLQYLRKYGSDEQIVDDYPFVVWLKHKIKEDPNFITHIKEEIIPGEYTPEREKENRKRFKEFFAQHPI